MSCDTAKRWFVSDKEWNAATEDYALVHLQASLVRAKIDDTNERPREPCVESAKDFSYHVKTQFTLFPYYFMRSYGYQLIYADVDDTNPEHKQMVMDKALKPNTLEQEEVGYTAVREKYMKSLINAEPWKDSEVVRRCQAERLESDCRSGFVDFKSADILFKLEHGHDQQRFLHVLSGQTLVKDKRPVMLLIHMIDPHQTTTPGSTDGYTIAFDVLENRLIIRPFHSDKETHPLTKPWNSKAPIDGISFSGTPHELVYHIIETMNSSEDLENHPLRLLVHGYATSFLLKHWDALIRTSGLSSEEAKKLEAEIRARYYIMQTVLMDIECPVAEKRDAIKFPELDSFRSVLDMLVAEENEFRDQAIQAKSNAHETMAQNAAKVHEKVFRTIEAFLEDPMREISLD